jgi:hypothetical protein
MSRRAFVLLSLLIATAYPQRAIAANTEVDLRDYTYTFAAPDGAIGPWHVSKLDLEQTTGTSHVLVRYVTGNRDDPGRPAHGQYLRLEDAQTISPCFSIVGGLGAGGGYMPLRTSTAEILGRPTATFPVALAAGIELSSINPTTFQRIVAAGPTFRFGNVYGYARYYRPSVPDQSYAVAPSGAFDLGVRATRRLDVTGVYNFGGEIGGDRTASELPTSSGRYGQDVGTGLKYGLSNRFGASVFYERAWYRQAPNGQLARRQAVIAGGFYLR